MKRRVIGVGQLAALLGVSVRTVRRRVRRGLLPPPFGGVRVVPRAHGRPMSCRPACWVLAEGEGEVLSRLRGAR